MVQLHQHFNLFDHLLLEKVIICPPFSAPGVMSNEACFLYAIRGNSRVYSAEEEYTLSTNEGVVMKCGIYLNHWLENEGKDTCEAIAVHFKPEVLRKIYEKELPPFFEIKPPEQKMSMLQKVKADKLLANYIDSLQFYFENPSLVSDELLKLKLKELILLLIKTENAENIQNLFTSLFTPEEYTFKRTIENNIFSNLTNEQLAFLTNLSLSSFKREFEKIYHTSPAKFFKQRKLERAAQLLSGTNQRIGDIAFECGFKEISHFSKSFHQVYQMRPSQYRQKSQSDQ